MHQNGSQKEEGNFLNLLQKEGVPSEKGGGEVPTLEKTMAFDRVWHAGLLCKVKSYAVLDQVFCLNFLFSQYYGFVWEVLTRISIAGASQGSILGSALFLLYINYLADVVISYCYLC